MPYNNNNNNSGNFLDSMDPTMKFAAITVIPYATSAAIIYYGNSRSVENKTYWYALGFSIYLIATFANQTIAYRSSRELVAKGGGTDVDKSNYQFAIWSARGTAVLMLLAFGYIYKGLQVRKVTTYMN